MREGGVRDDVGERRVCLDLVLLLSLRRCRTAARRIDRRLPVGRDGDRQPQRVNGLEGEPELGAGLTLFERRDPEPAGVDALTELRLREAVGHPRFAHQGADGCGVEWCGHEVVC